MMSKRRGGSNSLAMIMRQPNCTEPRVRKAQPEVWNIGMKFITVSPSRIMARAKAMRALLVSPRWCSSAPFGKPVVPEVYWICAGSSGLTSLSACSIGPRAKSAASSVTSTTSRSAGMSAATSAAMSAIGLPRYSGVMNSPTERDCSSTNLSSRGR